MSAFSGGLSDEFDGQIGGVSAEIQSSTYAGAGATFRFTVQDMANPTTSRTCWPGVHAFSGGLSDQFDELIGGVSVEIQPSAYAGAGATFRFTVFKGTSFLL